MNGNRHPTTDSYVIGGGVVYDGTRFLADGALRVEEGRITAVGPTAEIVAAASSSGTGACGDASLGEQLPVIDVGGRLILPGLINAHTHLYSSLATGLVPAGPTETFTQILENLWWRLDAVHNEESIYYSAVAGIIDHVRCGTTTIFDHHASMSLVDGSLDLVARAFEEASIRGTLCFETSDRTGTESARSHIRENVRFWESHARDTKLRGTMGLHANLTLSNETLEAVASARDDAMAIHIHAGEAPEDLAAGRAGGCGGPVDRLSRFGLLDSESILVHAIHLSDRDHEILHDVRPTVVTAPQSNANNSVGHMDYDRITWYKLGTDGMTGDMIATLRHQYLTLRASGGDTEYLGRSFFDTQRTLAQRFFPGVGEFTPDAPADIAVFDYVPVTPIDESSVVSHLIFGLQRGRAYMTIAGGQIVFQNGEVTFCDESEFRHEAMRVAKQLHERFYG